jgi:hypothetical protein
MTGCLGSNKESPLFESMSLGQKDLSEPPLPIEPLASAFGLFFGFICGRPESAGVLSGIVYCSSIAKRR